MRRRIKSVHVGCSLTLSAVRLLQLEYWQSQNGPRSLKWGKQGRRHEKAGPDVLPCHVLMTDSRKQGR